MSKIVKGVMLSQLSYRSKKKLRVERMHLPVKHFFLFCLAECRGFEPLPTVLETVMLPTTTTSYILSSKCGFINKQVSETLLLNEIGFCLISVD